MNGDGDVGALHHDSLSNIQLVTHVWLEETDTKKGLDSDAAWLMH